MRPRSSQRRARWTDRFAQGDLLAVELSAPERVEPIDQQLCASGAALHQDDDLEPVPAVRPNVEPQPPLRSLARARAVGTKSGKAIGRPRRGKATDAQVRDELAKGTGVLKTAKIFGLGTGTVQKIKQAAAGS